MSQVSNCAVDVVTSTTADSEAMPRRNSNPKVCVEVIDTTLLASPVNVMPVRINDQPVLFERAPLNRRYSRTASQLANISKRFQDAFAAFVSAACRDLEEEESQVAFTSSGNLDVLDLVSSSIAESSYLSCFNRGSTSVQSFKDDAERNVNSTSIDADKSLFRGNVSNFEESNEVLPDFSNDSVYFVLTTNSKGQVVKSIVDPNDISLYPDFAVYKQSINADTEIEVKIVRPGNMAVCQDEQPGEPNFFGTSDVNEMGEKVIYAQDSSGILTPIDPFKLANDVAPQGKQFVYIQDNSTGRIIRAITDENHTMVPGQQVYYIQNEEKRAVNSVKETNDNVKSKPKAGRRITRSSRSSVDVNQTVGSELPNCSVPAEENEALISVVDSTFSLGSEVGSRQQQIAKSVRQAFRKMSEPGTSNPGERSSGFSMDNNLSGLNMLAELSYLLAGQDISRSTNMAPYLSSPNKEHSVTTDRRDAVSRQRSVKSSPSKAPSKDEVQQEASKSVLLAKPGHKLSYVVGSVSPNKQARSKEHVGSESPNKQKVNSKEHIGSVSPNRQIASLKEHAESVSSMRQKAISKEHVGSESPTKQKAISKEHVGSKSPTKQKAISKEHVGSESSNKQKAISKKHVGSESPNKQKANSKEHVGSESPIKHGKSKEHVKSPPPKLSYNDVDNVFEPNDKFKTNKKMLRSRHNVQVQNVTDSPNILEIVNLWPQVNSKWATCEFSEDVDQNNSVLSQKFRRGLMRRSDALTNMSDTALNKLKAALAAAFNAVQGGVMTGGQGGAMMSHSGFSVVQGGAKAGNSGFSVAQGGAKAIQGGAMTGDGQGRAMTAHSGFSVVCPSSVTKTSNSVYSVSDDTSQNIFNTLQNFSAFMQDVSNVSRDDSTTKTSCTLQDVICSTKSYALGSGSNTPQGELVAVKTEPETVLNVFNAVEDDDACIVRKSYRVTKSGSSAVQKKKSTVNSGKKIVQNKTNATKSFCVSVQKKPSVLKNMSRIEIGASTIQITSAQSTASFVQSTVSAVQSTSSSVQSTSNSVQSTSSSPLKEPNILGVPRDGMITSGVIQTGSIDGSSARSSSSVESVSNLHMNGSFVESVSNLHSNGPIVEECMSCVDEDESSAFECDYSPVKLEPTVTEMAPGTVQSIACKVNEKSVYVPSESKTTRTRKSTAATEQKIRKSTLTKELKKKKSTLNKEQKMRNSAPSKEQKMSKSTHFKEQNPSLGRERSQKLSALTKKIKNSLRKRPAVLEDVADRTLNMPDTVHSTNPGGSSSTGTKSNVLQRILKEPNSNLIHNFTMDATTKKSGNVLPSKSRRHRTQARSTVSKNLYSGALTRSKDVATAYGVFQGGMVNIESGVVDSTAAIQSLYGLVQNGFITGTDEDMKGFVEDISLDNDQCGSVVSKIKKPSLGHNQNSLPGAQKSGLVLGNKLRHGFIKKSIIDWTNESCSSESDQAAPARFFMNLSQANRTTSASENAESVRFRMNLSQVNRRTTASGNAASARFIMNLSHAHKRTSSGALTESNTKTRKTSVPVYNSVADLPCSDSENFTTKKLRRSQKSGSAQIKQKATSTATRDRSNNAHARSNFIPTLATALKKSGHDLGKVRSSNKTRKPIFAEKENVRKQNPDVKIKPNKVAAKNVNKINISAVGRRHHNRIHPQEKCNQCDLCGKYYSTKYNLAKHKLFHTGKRPYKCDICMARFTQSGHLYKHRRIHTGEKPYKCDNCGSAFTTSTDMITHKRIHTGEKPYTCDICGRSFSSFGNCRDHKRIHTGEKPYKCDVCGSCFNTGSVLKKHKRVHTGERPYKCDVCNDSFTQIGHLIKHKTIHAANGPFKCDLCNAAFNVSYHLRRHRTKHKGHGLRI